MEPITRSANGDHDAPALLMGIRLVGKSCDIGGQKVDGDRSNEFLDTGFATRSAFGRVGTVNAVDEFNGPTVDSVAS